MNTTRTLVAGAVAALALTPLALVPAQAADGDVIRTGSCTSGTDWKVKAKARDGRIEFEGEIDSNRNGQTWRWRILHDGSLSARGTAVTRAPSGSFSVERRMVNLAGTDRLVFRAVHRASGEVCRGTLVF